MCRNGSSKIKLWYYFTRRGYEIVLIDVIKDTSLVMPNRRIVICKQYCGPVRRAIFIMN